MKDAIPKFLFILFGLASVFVVGGFIMLAINSTKSSGQEALKKSTDMTNSMLNMNITQYNRDDVDGSEVINAISTFMDSSEEIYIKVDNVCYIYPSGSVTPDGRESKDETLNKLNAAKKKGAANYISPRGKYTGRVVYMSDDDSVIEGIVFTKNN